MGASTSPRQPSFLRRSSRSRGVAAALLLLVAGTGVERGPVRADGPFPTAPGISLTLVTRGLILPVAITHAGDGSGRLFVTEQFGTIRIYGRTGLRPLPFLNIRPLVACCGERGLLSTAFHPDYETNGFFFVNYVDVDGNTVIARYRVSDDPNVADPSSARVLLRIDQPFSNHKGGQLQFGPDGYLYIGMGDGGSGGDPDNRSQNLLDLLGKILRIDVDQNAATAPFYGIPPSNPFTGDPDAHPEIWAYGVRNPWRFSFDRASGDLFIGDNGQVLYDEIDYLPAGAPPGRNFGWRRMEGAHCYDPPTNCNDGSLTLPILEYGRTPGFCSAVIGGYRYRGSEFPQLHGVYLYSDFCTQRVWGATQDDAGRWTTRVVFSGSMSISSFGEDEAGQIFAADYHGGTLRRVASTTSYAAPIVSSLAPSASIAGDPAMTLTVRGLGFAPGSVVRWDGIPRATHYLSATRLTASIPASDLSSVGTKTVTVRNPTPGGGVSAGLPFRVNSLFLDVPPGSFAASAIEAVAAAGVTGGCGSRRFCPGSAASRAQTAVFLLRARLGGTYAPPAATGDVFADVPEGSFAAAWIEDLSARGISAGCGAGAFCPESPVTRAEVAVLLLRATHGPSYTPPPATGTRFTDVAATSFAAPWIEQLAAEGITAGCGGGKFCPTLPVTRAELAVFLVRAFDLAPS